MTKEEFKEKLVSLAKDKENYDMIWQGIQAMQFMLQFQNELCSTKKLPVHKEEQTMKIQGVTIYRNPKASTWYTRKRINGEQVYIAGKTQRQVAEKLKKLLNIEEKQKVENYTLAVWYEKWLQLFKIHTVKEVTIHDYHKTIKNVPQSIMDKRLDKITCIDIILLLESIDKERTRQKTYELLKMLFEKAVQMDILKSNIFTKIDRPRHIREKGIALTNKQQFQFLYACDHNLYGDLFKITMMEGLRIGEILALTGNDIDLDRKCLNINKALAQNKLDTTKNEQSIRSVPIFADTEKILKKYLDYGSKRLFPVTYSCARRNMKLILQEANLPGEISIHDLRHTFITNCKNRGIPEHIVQSWVGHEIGSKVTSQIYTHVTEDANLLYIKKFEEYNSSILLNS